MHLLVKNNLLYTKNKSFRCSIGTNGFTDNKVEGDLCTPTGKFNFNEIFYRRDKLGETKFLLPTYNITENDGWCDEPRSDFYNQHIKFPFKDSAENLYRSDDLYDIVCVISYNTDPVLPGKGSAIFLHVASHDFNSTHGCVALGKEDMIEVAKQINQNSIITISN